MAIHDIVHRQLTPDTLDNALISVYRQAAIHVNYPLHYRMHSAVC